MKTQSHKISQNLFTSFFFLVEFCVLVLLWQKTTFGMVPECYNLT